MSIGGRDVATLVWKHDRNSEINTVPAVQRKTTVKSVRASPPSAAASPPATKSIRPERGESDDSDNTDSEEEGYDSDVQHDRSMDYNARILIDPVRSKQDKPETTRSSGSNQKPM